MEHLNTIKNQLKNRLPKEGITPILKALKELLPEHAPKRNSLLQLEADYRALKMQFVDGVIAPEDYSIAEGKIRKRLIELIDSLEADDFNVNLKRSRLRPDNKIKQGHVLYRIPRQMQLQKEVKCIVRIALDKVALVEDLDLDEHTQVRSEVRVSDYMKVLLIDPAASPAFAIRSDSEPVQFIDEDEATQWEFYVTPLAPGKHTLKLKVIVMEIINGVERVREKSLEESVVIVTEDVVEDVNAPLQSADMDFFVSDAAYNLEKKLSNFRLPKDIKERDLEKLQELKGAAIDAAAVYINKVAQNISASSRSMDDVMRDLSKVMAVRDQLAEGTAAQGTLGAGNGGVGGGAESNFVSHFYEVIVELKKANLEKSVQRTLLEALFHLTGSLLGNAPVEQMQVYIVQVEALQLPQDLREFVTAKLPDLYNSIKKDDLL